VHFFASERSSKSTGNILNVDAGHAPSFTGENPMPETLIDARFTR
jgi:hypothetical protein